VERLVVREDQGYIVFEGVVLSPNGRRVIVGTHVLVGSENAVLVLVPLLVETAADELEVRMLRGKVAPLVASNVVLVKVPLILFLVALALRRDSKPLLSAECFPLLLLLLKVTAWQEVEHGVGQEGGDLLDQHMGETAYEGGREDALELALGEEQGFLSPTQAEHSSQQVDRL